MTPPGYTFQKYDDHVVFYCLETNVWNVPEVTACMRVDRDLHVKLFYKGSPLPLPRWFRHGRDCRLTRKKYDAKLSKLHQMKEVEQTFSILSSKTSNFRKKECSRPMSFDILSFCVIPPYKHIDC